MFSIGQLARKIDDTELVKRNLEGDFRGLLEEARRMNLTEVVEEEDLRLKAEVERT